VAADRCDLLCLDLDKAERLRLDGPDPGDVELAAAGAKALGDPTRLLIAALLRSGDELCVCDVSWIVERSDKLVSHHLRALRAAGVVGSRRDGKMVMYSLTESGRALLDAVFPSSVEAAA
jgi:ArsR family transcriptional regulator, lead/cadmium/zinc/bismuth-responsive transcriptional repressor